MFKQIGWLTKLIASALILSFLSIWTTGYIVTSYVETLLKQFNVPLEVPPMAMSGVWGKLWGADPLLATDQDEAIKANVQSSGGETKGDSPLAVDAYGEVSNPPLTDIGIGSGTQANGGAAPDTGGTEEGTAGVDGTETAVTTDDLNETKDQMSDEDKDQLFALFMGKLPQQSWQTISKYVEDGLTEKELTEVQQIMAQHLNKTEYEQMMGILKKY